MNGTNSSYVLYFYGTNNVLSSSSFQDFYVCFPSIAISINFSSSHVCWKPMNNIYIFRIYSLPFSIIRLIMSMVSIMDLLLVKPNWCFPTLFVEFLFAVVFLRIFCKLYTEAWHLNNCYIILCHLPCVLLVVCLLLPSIRLVFLLFPIFFWYFMFLVATFFLHFYTYIISTWRFPILCISYCIY